MVIQMCVCVLYFSLLSNQLVHAYVVLIFHNEEEYHKSNFDANLH